MITFLPFFLGFFSSLASGLAVLRMMPPKGFVWGRILHWAVAMAQFWVSIIYFLIMAGAFGLTPKSYAHLLYPVSVLILSPGWVVYVTMVARR